MTGRELLTLAGKNPPERYQLNMKVKGGKGGNCRSKWDYCFTKPRSWKNSWLCLLIKQKDKSPRRQFNLLEDDVSFLNLGLLWETLSDSTGIWVVIIWLPCSSGYNVQKTVAIKIEPGYPPQLDMAYFSSCASRADGQPIGATSTQMIDGKSFQRWSVIGPGKIHGGKESTISAHIWG